MLPRVTITPDVSGRAVSKNFSSKAKPQADGSRRKPVHAAYAPASRPSGPKALANVTVEVAKRRSFEKQHSALEAPGIQSCLLDTDSPQDLPQQQQALSHTSESSSSCQLSSSPTATPCSSSANLARSDSELALLLNGTDPLRPGTTTINIGSIPIQVPIAVVEVPAAASATEAALAPAAELPAQQQADTAAVVAAAVAPPEPEAAAAAAAASSKLKATSAEFYPQAYLAAAAVTALAAQSTTSGNSSSNQAAGEGQQQHEQADAAGAAGDAAEQQSVQLEPAHGTYLQEKQQQQQNWQHWQQQWPQQQWPQQQWPQQQWPQHQQQAVPVAVPMFFPVPVPVPPYIMPAYPIAYQQMQQMHQMQQMQQMPMQPLMLPSPQQQQQHVPAAAEESSLPATPDASFAASSSGYAPLSPAPSLPADTSSLMSSPRGAAAGWALAHSSSLYSSSSRPGSSRPGSSASSVASGYSSMRGRQQQQQQSLRDAGTVTVSGLSCVKDAAGALAKVVSRHGSCLLLSLSHAGDQAAQATHVAAKSLAVARFYVNAHMAAAGAAGVDAAAVLTGLEPSTPAAAAAADEEVVFVPFSSTASMRSGRAPAAAAAEAEPTLGFIVAKAGARDLPVVLPPPVGIPACMQDRQQQQQGASEAASSSTVAAAPPAAAVAATALSPAPLLKAGASTDVNKLSNAIIHNVLGCNHVALQLAGAAACHVAMKALIKARARLQRKFGADIVATASFANEDTSSSIGRSTVFLRLDVMRSNLLQQLTVGAAGVGVALVRAAAGVVGQQQQQQQQLASVAGV